MKKVIVRVTGAMALAWLVAVIHFAQPVQAQDALPPGEGRETVIRICSECHGVEQLAAFRRSRPEWQQLVQDMAGGADPADLAAIVKYAVARFGKINVNRATAAELVEVVGLSEAEAAATVDYRTKNGEFKNLDDLKKVPGIDAAKLEAQQDAIAFTGA